MSHDEPRFCHAGTCYECVLDKLHKTREALLQAKPYVQRAADQGEVMAETVLMLVNQMAE